MSGSPAKLAGVVGVTAVTGDPVTAADRADPVRLDVESRTETQGGVGCATRGKREDVVCDRIVARGHRTIASEFQARAVAVHRVVGDRFVAGVRIELNPAIAIVKDDVVLDYTIRAVDNVYTVDVVVGRLAIVYTIALDIEMIGRQTSIARRVDADTLGVGDVVAIDLCARSGYRQARERASSYRVTLGIVRRGEKATGSSIKVEALDRHTCSRNHDASIPRCSLPRKAL